MSLEVVPGTYEIDPVHSSVAFSIRHMMVSKVKGSFETFSGVIEVREPLQESSVTGTVDAASVDTGNADRDNHLRSEDFFNVAAHPEWTFASTSVREEGQAWFVDGDLTLAGVTRPITLEVEPGGFVDDGEGGTRAGATATTTIRRSEFGIEFNQVLETGGVMLGDDVQVTIEISATKR